MQYIKLEVNGSDYLAPCTFKSKDIGMLLDRLNDNNIITDSITKLSNENSFYDNLRHFENFSSKDNADLKLIVQNYQIKSKLVGSFLTGDLIALHYDQDTIEIVRFRDSKIIKTF